jgi:hypothetical protein
MTDDFEVIDGDGVRVYVHEHEDKDDEAMGMLRNDARLTNDSQ